MAFVIDEYGGLEGLVTVVDILEAIVGDIPSPEELAEPPALQRADGSWLLDGLLPIEDVHDVLDIAGPRWDDSGDYHTLAGLVMHQLGRIPSAGDRFAWRGRTFEVVDMDGNRVDKVLVMPAASDGPYAGGRGET